MRAVYDSIVENNIVIICTENQLPIVPCKFLFIGCGENDRAAAWALKNQVIPTQRMRVKGFRESTSIAELGTRVEE